MTTIKTWPKFAKQVRPNNDELLKALPNYKNSILVAGCQRSGGTMLAKAITDHPEITPFAWSKDAELDAALLLSGHQEHAGPIQTNARYCFQTTYLNERAVEYLEHAEHFHLVWLIRNPYSVIYSMLYNWKRFALNEVFLGCGLELLPDQLKARYERFGLFGVRPLDRACYAWLGKVRQCEMLMERLPAKRMITLNYEDLVQNKKAMLNSIYEFALLSVEVDGESDITTRSMKKSNALSTKERVRVEELCQDQYEQHSSEHIRLHP